MIYGSKKYVSKSVELWETGNDIPKVGDNLENSLTVTLVDHSNNYDETKINSECICFFTVEDNVPTQVFRKVRYKTVAKPSFVHHKRLKFHVSRYVFIVHAFESFSHIFCTNLE